MSPVCFVLMLLIMTIIPALIYSFFFIINIPCLPYYRPPQAQAASSSSSGSGTTTTTTKLAELTAAAAVVTAKEATSGAAGDCPVCLSAFVEGEEIWQLNLCKHLFHALCIDRWLYTHSNCPVCRSYVSLSKRKLPTPPNRPSGVAAREDDLWLGLPNSAGLV